MRRILALDPPLRKADVIANPYRTSVLKFNGQKKHLLENNFAPLKDRKQGKRNICNDDLQRHKRTSQHKG